MRSPWIAYLLLVGLLSAGMLMAEDDAEGVAATSENFPRTMEKFWYRKGEKARFGKMNHGTGDVTLTGDAIEFNGDKKGFIIRLSEIEAVSVETMKGDVDTTWVILDLDREGEWGTVAFRDGSRLGYGNRTREFYDALKQLLRGAKAGQYAAQKGFRAYEVEGEFSLALPETWTSHLEHVIYLDDGRTLGRILFSSQAARRLDEETRRLREDEEVLEAIRTGEIAAFFVDRREIVKGMNCNGISPKAQKRLLQWALEDPVFAEGNQVVAAPAVEPDEFGDCKGVALRGTSRSADGVERVLLLRVIAHEKTVYLFGVRAVADRFDEFRQPLDRALTTLELRP